MRNSVKQFANAMEKKLQLNDHKGCYGWNGDEKMELLKKLAGEMIELSISIAEKDEESIRSEACDIANYAMMIWDHRSVN